MNNLKRSLLYTKTIRKCYSTPICGRLYSDVAYIKNNVVGCPIPDIPISNLPLNDFIWENIDKYSDLCAVECSETGRNITYGDLHRKAKILAGFLQKIGLQQRDAVGILMPNIPEYIIAILGSLEGGFTATTINPAYTAYEIKHQLTTSKAKIVFTISETYPNLKKAIDDMPGADIKICIVPISQNESIPAGCIKFSEIMDKSYSVTLPNWDAEEVAMLPFSSGTTGLSKGVELRHRNIVANILQGREKCFNLMTTPTDDHQDIVPLILPVYHIYGLSPVALAALSQGVKLVSLQKFSTAAYFNLLSKYKANVLYLVPPIVLMMLNSPLLKIEYLSQLRNVVSGAAPLGAADVERFTEKTLNKVSFVQYYGMTEASPLTHAQTSDVDGGIEIGGTGFPVVNTEVKVVDTNSDSTEALPHNTSGEILIRGPQIMKGYLNNPEATASTITSDGFLRTGDIGHYNESGHFFITDRLKELIKVSGFQVPPAELEALIRSHPDVVDVGVIGVPDDKRGEAPKAFVVLKDSAKCKSEDIFNYVAERTVKYKHLTGGVVIMDSIPKTASGKILRRDLKKLK